MTRRIAIAILLTVWAMLIAGGCLAYFTTRSILLRNLDEALMARALSRAAQSLPAGSGAAIVGGERYVIKNELNQTVAGGARYDSKYEPQILSRQFSHANGVRYRTITVRYFAFAAGGGAPDDPARPFTA